MVIVLSTYAREIKKEDYIKSLEVNENLIHSITRGIHGMHCISRNEMDKAEKKEC